MGSLSEYWLALTHKGKHEKKPVNFMFNTNVTNQVLLTPTVGKRIRLQVILISGEGNNGNVFIYRESSPITILPLWFSNSNKNNTSNELNMLLDVNEKITVTMTRRDGVNTFIGLGYTEEE